jgi:hypothetical protein
MIISWSWGSTLNQWLMIRDPVTMGFGIKRTSEKSSDKLGCFFWPRVKCSWGPWFYHGYTIQVQKLQLLW